MKPTFLKTLRSDYYSLNLFIMPFIFVVLGVIVYLEESISTPLFIVIGCAILSLIISLWRIAYVRNYIKLIYDNQTEAKVVKKTRTSKVIYVFLEYRINGESYETKVMLPKIKRVKQIEVNQTLTIIYDEMKKNKLFILDLYEEKNDTI